MSEVVTLTGGTTGTILGTYAAAVTYVDGAYGDSYTAWTALSADNRKRTLIAATRYIDRQLWSEDADTHAERDAIDEFQWASYELAVLVAEDSSVLAAVDTGSNIQSVTAGGAGVTFFKGTSSSDGTASVLPTVVDQLIGDYLVGESNIYTVFTGAGQSGDEDNPFDEGCDYDRGEPF